MYLKKLFIFLMILSFTFSGESFARKTPDRDEGLNRRSRILRPHKARSQKELRSLKARPQRHRAGAATRPSLSKRNFPASPHKALGRNRHHPAKRTAATRPFPDTHNSVKPVKGTRTPVPTPQHPTIATRQAAIAQQNINRAKTRSISPVQRPIKRTISSSQPSMAQQNLNLAMARSMTPSVPRHTANHPLALRRTRGSHNRP